LQQIRAFLFGGLYDFAGQIREKSVYKGGYPFVVTQYLKTALLRIDRLPHTKYVEIVDKYIAMNKAIPLWKAMSAAQEFCWI
jgi:cell filamentation protein